MGTIKSFNKECEACGAPFVANREWQLYCCVECRENVKKIYDDLMADIRMQVKDAATKLAKLKVNK